MRTILVRGVLLGACAMALSACGQKGELAHPTARAPTGRASLVQSLTPSLPASAPATATPAPTQDALPPLPLPGQ